MSEPIPRRRKCDKNEAKVGNPKAEESSKKKVITPRRLCVHYQDASFCMCMSRAKPPPELAILHDGDEIRASGTAPTN